MTEKTNVVKVPPVIYVSFDDDGEIEYSATEPDEIDKGTTRVAVYKLDHLAKVTHGVDLVKDEDDEDGDGEYEDE